MTTPASAPVEPVQPVSRLAPHVIPTELSVSPIDIKAYEMIKLLFGLTDAEMVTHSVQFALLCHGLGPGTKNGDLTETLMRQITTLNVLHGRVMDTISQVEKANALCAAAVTQAMHAIADASGRLPPSSRAGESLKSKP